MIRFTWRGCAVHPAQCWKMFKELLLPASIPISWMNPDFTWFEATLLLQNCQEASDVLSFRLYVYIFIHIVIVNNFCSVRSIILDHPKVEERIAPKIQRQAAGAQENPWINSHSYGKSPSSQGKSPNWMVHVHPFSIAVLVYQWKKPWYRNGSHYPSLLEAPLSIVASCCDWRTKNIQLLRDVPRIFINIHDCCWWNGEISPQK